MGSMLRWGHEHSLPTSGRKRHMTLRNRSSFLIFYRIACTLCVVTPYILLALGAPLLLPSLLDKAPRQGDIQEFAAARRVGIAILLGTMHVQCSDGGHEHSQPTSGRKRHMTLRNISSILYRIARTLCVVTPYILLAMGAPLLLRSLLDKAPRQRDMQEFAAARRVAIAMCCFFFGSHISCVVLFFWMYLFLCMFYTNHNSQNNCMKHCKS